MDKVNYAVQLLCSMSPSNLNKLDRIFNYFFPQDVINHNTQLCFITVSQLNTHRSDLKKKNL